MTEREKWLKRVQMYDFAMLEAGMFCDTHPNDTQALEYFQNCKNLFEKAKEQFTAKYGPLTMADLPDSADSWEWVKGPWPWEEQANVEL